MPDKEETDERPGPGVAEAESDSFLRSDPLVMCEVVLPDEVAFECLVSVGCSPDPVHIGGRGGVGASASAAVSGQAKHCRDLLMTLGSIKSHLAVHEDYIRLHSCRPTAGHREAAADDSIAKGLKPKSLFDLEASIVSLHKELMELGQYEAEMNSRYIHMVHLVNILDSLENVFWAAEAPRPVPSGIDTRTLLDDGAENATEPDNFEHTLPFTVGVVPTTKAYSLQLGIWRRLHLTALYTDVTVKDQRNLRDQPIPAHNIFLIVTLSQEQKRVADRLCGLLGAQVFDVPSGAEQRRLLADDAKEKLSEMRQVFLEGEEHRKRLALSGWNRWQRWFGQVCVIQAVYRALGQFSMGYSKLYYAGTVWCSRGAIDTVQEALSAGSSKAAGVRGSIRLVDCCDGDRRQTPTRMPLHELTSAVRDLIYQYGVPRYREIDPTPFTAVTFPFLFAVMFGDWGHGLLLLAFALALFIPPGSGRLLHPAVDAGLQPLRQMRHLLMLCALFAVYCGAVYNEGFGLTVGLRSRSKFSLGNLTYDTVVNRSMSGLQLTPRDDGYGMSWSTDSMWGGSANQVKFFNSARMKLSLVFGFLHLMLGLSLQLANDIHDGRLANLALFSVVKLVFHCLLMGYPVFLIVFKWTTVKPGDAACAPALLPMLIAMYQFSYTDTPCYLATFYPGQKYIEHCIVIGVAASALLAILGLPIYHSFPQRAELPEPTATHADATAEAANSEPAKMAPTAEALEKPPDTDYTDQLRDSDQLEQLELQEKPPEPQPPPPKSKSRRPHRHASLAMTTRGELDDTGSGRGSRSSRRKRLSSRVTTTTAGGQQHHQQQESLDLLEHLLACFEFLLSSLSHSASYLRLWAIGLAHGELTTIMWPMLLMPPTRLSDLLAGSPVASLLLGGFALALSFCLWAGITVLILVGMEGMTALLHSLRLHWIEFQSKFYSGDGYMFKPFCLKSVATQAAEACKDFSTPEEFQ